ncbi:KTSC domain-containing protein [Bacillus shivajii]|uniref:KTSC domain-containing protein n=1 Tax=Bacillus shivajii TaxID=1983719 RepID=UPI001CFB6CBB|nr:KTSC domain-containing protein [Bacillus shivajii]UCZ52065.1 KTSC domain-containing protein [Bacillus shivajii]
MEFVDLNYGNLKSVAYDEIMRELHVRFKDGDYMIYYEVFKPDYVGLLSSEDHTDFFQERIQPRYPCKMINDR